MATHRRLAGAMSLVGVAALAACSGGPTAAPPLVPRIVVHAVLDPMVAEQVVLVQQTRTDTSNTRGALSARDPIVSAGGIPISGARVVLIGPEGSSDSVVAVEDRAVRGDSAGAGVYRVKSVVRATVADRAPRGLLRLVPGATYRLVVQTPLSTVRGTTRIPGFAMVPDRVARRFNLDSDTLELPRPTSEVGAAAYVVRHALPGFCNSSRIVRGIRDRLLLPAAPLDSAWTFDADRRDIWPGTTQGFSVAAVDANYLRYSVAGADPFGDDVAGNTLQGGVGLFGSVVTLTDVSLDLVADRNHAIEGEWSPLGATAGLPISLRLYESPRFPHGSNGGLALTGQARLANGAGLVAQASLANDVITLTLAPSASASNARHFSGSFDGQTLILQAAGSEIRVKYHVTP